MAKAEFLQHLPWHPPCFPGLSGYQAVWKVQTAPVTVSDGQFKVCVTGNHSTLLSAIVESPPALPGALKHVGERTKPGHSRTRAIHMCPNLRGPKINGSPSQLPCKDNVCMHTHTPCAHTPCTHSLSHPSLSSPSACYPTPFTDSKAKQSFRFGQMTVHIGFNTYVFYIHYTIHAD